MGDVPRLWSADGLRLPPGGLVLATVLSVEDGQRITAALAEARAAGRREFAEDVAELIAGRLHLGPTTLGRLSAVVDRERGVL